MAARMCSFCQTFFLSTLKRQLWPPTLVKISQSYSSRAALYTLKPERLAQIQESPSGWVPPADPPPDLPFHLKRTRQNNLPVYTDIKRGGNLKITIIRKVQGDLKELEKCLRLHLGKDLDCQINELTSQVKIKGNHQAAAQKLLKGLGF